MGADGEKLYDGTGLEKHLDECQKVLLSVFVNLQTHTGHSKTSGHEFRIPFTCLSIYAYGLYIVWY